MKRDMPPTFVMVEDATTLLLEAAKLLSQEDQKPEDKQKLLDGSRGRRTREREREREGGRERECVCVCVCVLLLVQGFFMACLSYFWCLIKQK